MIIYCYPCCKMNLWMKSVFIVIIIAIALFSRLVALEAHDDFTPIKLSTGEIRGKYVKTSGNVEGYQFLGIPYAEAPIGELRYRDPQPKRKWSGTLDATDFRESCFWNSSTTSNDPNKTPMSEDCLFINVLTSPKCLRHGNCSVLVYIHGGGFDYDTPSLYPPDFLIENFLTEDRSVLFVMPAYRLGSFGFLNLSPDAPSSAVRNVAFKDLIEALRWVQREIAKFGGSPDKVTIMGHSSGATTVNLFTMSPLTKGLFSKAIVMSGEGLKPLPYDTNRMASVQLAASVGCAHWNTNFNDLKQTEKVLKCLRGVDAKRLIVQQRRLEDQGVSFSGPCIDGPHGVLPESTINLRRKRHPVRLMIGSTSQEFHDTVFLLEPHGRVNLSQLWIACEKAVYEMAFKNHFKTCKDCFKEYINPKRAPYIFDDTNIFVPSALSCEDINNAGLASFLYEFQYRHVGKAFHPNSRPPAKMTPAHTQDLVYIMGIHKGVFTPKDDVIRVKYSQLFVNFVKNGDPSIEGEPKWIPYSPSDDNFFVVDFDEENHMPGMRNGYHRSALNLWNGTAFRDSGGMLDRISERESLQFLIQNDSISVKNPEMMQFLEDTNFLGKMTAEALSRSIKTLQDMLPEEMFDGGSDGKDPHTIGPSNQGNWNLYFWIAVLVAVILGIILLITCVMLCYNYEKRRHYERII